MFKLAMHVKGILGIGRNLYISARELPLNILPLGRVQAATDVEGQALLDEGHQGSACIIAFVFSASDMSAKYAFQPLQAIMASGGS
jgi:hypothetical protein